MQLKEDFLHFIWKFRLYQLNGLHDGHSSKIEVIHPGFHNHDAGPDFSKAKIIIDDTLWVGQVEIHLKSSDWLLHGHQHQAAYDNVILHVVHEHDQVIFRSNGSVLPVLSLKGRYDEALLERYDQLIGASNYFPCQQQLSCVDPIFINHFLSGQLIARLQSKAEAVHEVLAKNHGDWERTFYHFVCRSFGFKVNALPFELLASSLDVQLIRKYSDQPLQVEALIFGQAGFLQQSFEDDYPRQLRHEYSFLRKKHGLTPIDVSLWKFLRMRPGNFPTVRLAQLAALLIRHPHLFSTQLALLPLEKYAECYQQLPIHAYWIDHFHFNKQSVKSSVQLGKASIENMLMNTNCLFLYVYGRYTDQHSYVERALDLLSYLPAEKNRLVDHYKDAGLKMESAYTSQAVLQLNKSFCSQKKCLNCSIGIKILKR